VLSFLLRSARIRQVGQDRAAGAAPDDSGSGLRAQSSFGVAVGWRPPGAS